MWLKVVGVGMGVGNRNKEGYMLDDGIVRLEWVNGEEQGKKIFNFVGGVFSYS